MQKKNFLWATFLFLALAFMSGCVQPKEAKMEKVSFQTEDGVTIVGNYLPAESGKAVLLLHMMPATKESWEAVQEDLNKQGYSVLAIDLRGHGESVKKDGEVIDYKKFSDEEHAESIRDVKAAISFLEQKGARSFAIIGASIGANLALVYGAGDEKVRTAILLSPGLDYRSVKTEPFAEKFDRPLLIVASDDDTYSAQSSKVLAEAAPNATLQMLSGVGHGTNMFADAGLKPAVLEWIGKNL